MVNPLQHLPGCLVYLVGRRSWLILLFCLYILVHSVHASDKPLFIYANTLPQNIANDRSKLSLIFTGRIRHWPDGSAIKVVFLPKTHPDNIRFCRTNLNLVPRSVHRSWERIIFAGYGRAPITAQSLEEAARIINETPGAIGFTDIAPNSKIKSGGGIYVFPSE